MKVTLEFTLPDEREELEIHQKAMAMFCVLGDLDRELRAMCKYGDFTQEKLEAFQQVRDMLFEFCKDQGVEI